MSVYLNWSWYLAVASVRRAWAGFGFVFFFLEEGESSPVGNKFGDVGFPEWNLIKLQQTGLWSSFCNYVEEQSKKTGIAYDKLS